MFITTDEFILHQFGAICGNDIFVLRFENVVSINFYIQMESKQGSVTLAQQVQALAATVEELTKQNQEMRLWLQHKGNRSRTN